MKPLVLKTVLLSAAVLFGVILIMTITGGFACACGAGDSFYCGIFCTAGKTILGFSMIFITAYVIRALRS